MLKSNKNKQTNIHTYKQTNKRTAFRSDQKAKKSRKPYASSAARAQNPKSITSSKALRPKSPILSRAPAAGSRPTPFHLHRMSRTTTGSLPCWLTWGMCEGKQTASKITWTRTTAGKPHLNFSERKNSLKEDVGKEDQNKVGWRGSSFQSLSSQKSPQASSQCRPTLTLWFAEVPRDHKALSSQPLLVVEPAKMDNPLLGFW